MRATSQNRVSAPQAVALACLLLAASAAAAQAPAPAPVRHHRKPHPAVVQPPPPAVVEPPKPDWPVNDRPLAAAVAWDQHSLRIDANNSSLEQILSQVASATGAKIDGPVADQRIFGVFGPGNVRDVLAQLLRGSGNNFVMVGDNGQGLPREVQLSARSAAASAQTGPHPQQQSDDDYDDTPDTSQVDTQPPVQPADNQPRTPQQVMQEDQQRQQQQLMQQQQGQPPNPQQQQPQ